jgi:predicted dehydrogenase
MKIGLIGTGLMGATHAAAWQAAGATLAGCVAESESEAAPLAAQYGARVYPTYADLLAAVDVVDICTPTHLHHEMILAAAAAGRHIVCEKPLARTVAQAEAAVQACRRAGVQLLVAQVVRYFPEYALAKAQVDSGRIGKPAVLRLARCGFRPRRPTANWFVDEAKSGGLLLDLMIHDFDYGRWVAGEVDSVFARLTPPGDYALAILQHRGGALTHVTAAWAYPPPLFRTRLEIAGDAGLIEFDSAAAAPIESLLAQPADSALPTVGVPASPLRENPYVLEIKEFYQSLAHGAPARVSADDGLAAVVIAHAAIESARTGRAVTLSAEGIAP